MVQFDTTKSVEVLPIETYPPYGSWMLAYKQDCSVLCITSVHYK